MPAQASLLLFRKEPKQFCDRVVITVHDPFFQRNDGVVGDVYVFRTYLGAALGDITQSNPSLLLDQINAIIGVEGMHFQCGQPDKEPRSGKVLFVLRVIANDVTDVLA